jgi:hypothetical protein
MAQGVIAGNVRANEHGGDVGRHTSQTGPLAGSGGQDHHRLSTPSETRRSKDGLFGEPRPLGRPLEPESYVPPRSPDLGSTSSPLSPAIGPGSNGLGPEAGPPPRREPFNLRERSGARHRDR